MFKTPQSCRTEYIKKKLHFLITKRQFLFEVNSFYTFTFYGQIIFIMKSFSLLNIIIIIMCLEDVTPTIFKWF